MRQHVGRTGWPGLAEAQAIIDKARPEDSCENMISGP
jgi:hypothetical protein